ncbi:MAG: UDP-N-acetylmuramate dehydrogenase [Oscillospiraceae bacterium]|jgi:UDP-N-acetylmuramate dehydrogenase|nr:UDP-N-acetylmuramate dehydrogenase [Oscillospiraceae bacterium]
MINYNKIEKICRKYGADFEINAPLALYTTFKIGGPCDFLIKINNQELVSEIVKSEIPFRILGNGSNVLVKDEGIRGAVLLFGRDFANVFTDNENAYCEAGANLTSVCHTMRDASLTGLEFAYGIPGTVGGAVYMNAGAYDGEISNVLVYAEYIDEDGVIKRLNEGFSYRKSSFMSAKRVITSASFKLQKGDKAQIAAKMEDFMNRRRDKQPLEFPSAGSTFKRPEGDYASRLIDVCGLKGFSVGGAQVSEKHAGFIINKGNATCKDVLKLTEAVKERVFKETGFMLEREVEVLG